MSLRKLKTVEFKLFACLQAVLPPTAGIHFTCNDLRSLLSSWQWMQTTFPLFYPQTRSAFVRNKLLNQNLLSSNLYG